MEDYSDKKKKKKKETAKKQYQASKEKLPKGSQEYNKNILEEKKKRSC